MQSEQPHGQANDSTPFPPSSPTLFRHRSQPDGPESSGLHHRLPRTTSQESQQSSPHSVRIRIQSPFDASGASLERRKEGWVLPSHETIGQLKDDLAHGRLEGAGLWVRDDMRIVYHGRIVRDQEKVGDVVGKIGDHTHVSTLHLVARRAQATPIIQLPNPIDSSALGPQPSVPAAHAVSSDSSVNSLALSDSIHYLLFTSRHHLFSLLGLEPLKWENTVPPPVVSQSEAREAVLSVVKAYAAHRDTTEEGWDNWELAFAEDSDDGLKRVWDETGQRHGIEREINDLWSCLLNRNWSNRDVGEKAEVEIDGTVYLLDLPALSACTPAQLTHLLIYLRITSLIPLLNSAFYEATQQETQSRLSLSTVVPTTIGSLPPNVRVVYRRTFRFSLPYIPRPVFSHFFFSTFKVFTMLWMLTRGMKWTDPRYWAIAGIAWGWWAVDGWNVIAVFLRNRQANELAQEAERAVHNGRQAIPAGTGFEANQPRQAPAQGNNAPNHRRNHSPHALSTSFAPLVHLSIDNIQLRIPPPSSRQPDSFAPAPRTQPPRFQTQVLLPVFLWAVTLIPGWETARASLIRKRERQMRALVNATNPELRQAGESAEQAPEMQRELELPAGLSVPARDYYLRVLSSRDTIDWNEEREAQRAIGVGEEQDERERIGLL
ncbi:hypothetical protein I307_03048 [Cryptococcus deuterogattii 99/473]|uniref:Unplaced genomic scaffold supercont1.12, whole genome shotgun sequence n=2 Tax=Cryptococcus deuterogattii TaxID=1859096 RepID=A0A0D0TTU2_9TREE|nr:hypothetical protein CNBG_5492 [Cryptococcus deuterogattii R265]KIR39208.1 hypothetical protein I313_04807 [Cryptococcus deuterogattii Ram5]KIR71190.1 hypothetical protein I310_05083 [Cryptococcus deuterogattii CA1014]KIY57554.1 hypothetical protein I307_03048 [Cryptococcus deuterogattii 99/473]